MKGRITKKITSEKEIQDNTKYVYQKGNISFFKDCSGVWVILGKTSVVFPTLDKTIEFLF